MMLRFPVTIMASLTLAACFGGGGGSGGGSGGGALSRPTIIALTGGQAAEETASDQSARAPGIVARADSRTVSTLYGDTDDRILRRFDIEADCSGSECVLTNQTLGFRHAVSARDLGGTTTGARALLTKNGITIMEGVETDYRSYGAWLSHSAFSTTEVRQTVQLGDIDVSLSGRLAVAGGDLTGSRPSVVAIWRGLMTGTPQYGSDKGDALQGDATLTFKTAGNLIDAEFDSIVNLDLRRAHSVTQVQFFGVPVSSVGAFEAGSKGNRIQGGLYGPGHAEATGVFERSGIVGAFGAKRQ